MHPKVHAAKAQATQPHKAAHQNDCHPIRIVDRDVAGAPQVPAAHTCKTHDNAVSTASPCEALHAHDEVGGVCDAIDRMGGREPVVTEGCRVCAGRFVRHPYWRRRWPGYPAHIRRENPDNTPPGSRWHDPSCVQKHVLDVIADHNTRAYDPSEATCTVAVDVPELRSAHAGHYAPAKPQHSK